MGIKWKLFLAFLLSTTILTSIIIILSSELPKGLFIASSSIILIISFLIGYFVLQRIISPITDIIKGASAISEGNFTHKIRIDTRDELKELSEILNEMSEEFKKRMDEMDEDKARLSTILSTMSEGLLAIDCKGNILLANSVLSEMFGFKGASVIGRSYLEVIRHNQLNDIIREVLKERQNVIREIEQFFPEERYFAVYASVAEGIKEDGVCAVFIFHDITKIRRLERIRKDFVANVSHELRTPLTSIKGYTEALIDGAIDNSIKAKEFLTIIYNHTGRLNNILTDLLQLSYIESGQYKPKPVKVDLKGVVDRAIVLLKTNIEEKKFTVNIQIPEGLTVTADEDKLNLVFVNLIDNAIKYTPEKGRIGINAEARGKEVMVSVSDTGIGIPREDLARIFERFYRVDKDRSRELGGTGLGLSIVKHIIDAHGGRVWAESELNKGSSFYLTLKAV